MVVALFETHNALHQELQPAMVESEDKSSILDRDHPDFVTALERGLSVLMAFENGPRKMTQAEVSARVGLSRGTARRLLLTLAELGFLAFDGKAFSLTPRVMRLGFSFLASLGFGETVQPIVSGLSARLGESCSMAVLDGEDMVFVARAETRNVYRTSLAVGVRLPAYPTALGRILLAGLPDNELDALLANMPLLPLTPQTITDRTALKAEIMKARHDRFAMVDGEIQIGVRSIAVPVLGRDGAVRAALNIGGVSSQVSFETMRNEYLPLLRAAARQIAEACG